MRWFRAALMMSIAMVGCDTPRPGGRDQTAPPEAPLAPPAQSRAGQARPDRAARARAPRSPLEADAKSLLTLDKVTPDTLCVTRGRLAGAANRSPPGVGASDLSQFSVEVPTFRAVAPGHAGDAANIKMIVHGTTQQERALSSGEMRRQIGLKLRATDGCNLVYVMWRLEPKPKLVVSVKSNPGMRTAKECGAGGYTNVKPWRSSPPPTMLPMLDDGLEHVLDARISGDTLYAWVDGQLAWEGTLPARARDLTGLAGVRSDNLSFDITGFSVDARTGDAVAPKCLSDESD